MLLSQQVYEVISTALKSNNLTHRPLRSAAPVTITNETGSEPRSLFEHIIMNDKPEIRAQEAIFPYLVAAGFHVSREQGARVKGARRIFDFVIRPQSADFTTSQAHDFSDSVIVELKHYSPHQTGQFEALLGPVETKAGRKLQSLYHDYTKPRPNAPMIQVGLYTAVEEVRAPALGRAAWSSSGSPFVRKYVKGKTLPQDYCNRARDALLRWTLIGKYTCPGALASALDFQEGPETSFTSATGVELTGRVNYFIGIVP